MIYVRRPTDENGAILLPTVIVLAIVGFMGVYAMQGSETQESMARHYQNRSVSFQAAQSGLQRGEGYLGNWSGQSPPETQTVATCTQPCVLKEDAFSWSPTQVSGWEKSQDVGELDNFAGDAEAGWEQANYYIEREQTVKDTRVVGQKRDQRRRVFYEINAYGVGSSGAGEVVLQSVYAKRYR